MDLLTRCCEFIKQFEGWSSEPYLPTPNDKPTIGWGNTRYEDMSAVTLDDDDIDLDRGQKLLEFWVQRTLIKVQDLCQVEVTDNQLVALTSFDYNTGALANSTLLKLLNDGDSVGAADEFPRWTHQAGHVLKGLVIRRQKEMEIFQL